MHVVELLESSYNKSLYISVVSQKRLQPYFKLKWYFIYKILKFTRVGYFKDSKDYKNMRIFNDDGLKMFKVLLNL